MKYIIIILTFIFITSYSYAKETCIKNDKGIFCGIEVTVEEKHNNQDQNKTKRECVEFNGKNVCGYQCKKNIWGADCKKEKDETCIENIHGVICGYNCINNISMSACASKSIYKCMERFGNAKCGFDCEYKFGELECKENDPNAKFLK